VADWDGRGLPPAASARLARFKAGGVRTSLLAVNGAVGAESVGFTPIGEVMGGAVQHLGWRGYGCGMYGGGSFGTARTVTSGQGRGWVGYAPYVKALYHGYDSALRRMVAEAQAMDADGVLGVRLSVDHLDQGNREFVALGTAVRASSAPVHPRRPFTTELAGQDFAKLLYAGWVPASIAIGISVAIRHDDWRTRQQSSSLFSGNVEVTGYTELVQFARADARQHFGERIQRAGADGAIVSSMGVDLRAIEPSDNHRDHLAEATVIGSAIARFHRGRSAPTDALTILPLRRA
jgi:uncharacterized protein YbjQ (UPF0145 family)